MSPPQVTYVGGSCCNRHFQARDAGIQPRAIVWVAIREALGGPTEAPLAVELYARRGRSRASTRNNSLILRNIDFAECDIAFLPRCCWTRFSYRGPTITQFRSVRRLATAVSSRAAAHLHRALRPP